MKFKFEKLIIWQKAMELGEGLNTLAEVVTCLHKAKRREYITEREFINYYDYSYNLMNMMVMFKSKIK